MKHEIFVVSTIGERDEYGCLLYENTTWNVRGNKWAIESYADHKNYGAGAKFYNYNTRKYESLKLK